jgi:hypothetical protein
MTYAVIETALQTILRELSDFTSADVSLTNYDVLDSGTGSKNKVVLRPGGIAAAPDTFATGTRTWGIYVDIFTIYHSDADWSEFKTMRENVVTKIEAHFPLDISTGQVILKSIESADDPIEVFDRAGGGPFFIMQRLRMTVDEYA